MQYEQKYKDKEKMLKQQINNNEMNYEKNNLNKLSKRTIVASILILIAIPATILYGVFSLNDRSYYFISIMIVIYTMLPFVMVFEKRKPQARELIIIAVLSGLAVAGRSAFFMLPQFKPVVAMVIIAGVCFGGEAGFLVGAVSGFVSNFFFGQGPWTPWQMFSFGIIGFLAGVLYKRGRLKKSKLSLCIFGGISTFFIYGGLMNMWTLLAFSSDITIATILGVYIPAIPFDFVHAVATVFFLFIISKSMIEKLDRIKVKYGMLEP